MREHHNRMPDALFLVDLLDIVEHRRKCIICVATVLDGMHMYCINNREHPLHFWLIETKHIPLTIQRICVDFLVVFMMIVTLTFTTMHPISPDSTHRSDEIVKVVKKKNDTIPTHIKYLY